MLVWKAMPSITPVMSPTRPERDDASIESMVCDLVHRSAPWRATSEGQRQPAGLACVVGVLFDVGGHFSIRRGSLLQSVGTIRCGPTGCCCPPAICCCGAGDGSVPLRTTARCGAGCRAWPVCPASGWTRHQAGSSPPRPVTLGDNAARDVARIDRTRHPTAAAGCARSVPTSSACTQRQCHGAKPMAFSRWRRSRCRCRRPEPITQPQGSKSFRMSCIRRSSPVIALEYHFA